jgi:PAS domain S-box-containing protein
MQATEGTSASALAAEYASALREYVSGAGEAALARAYELGRRAASEGVGVLELAMVHHEALLALPPGPGGGASPIAMAGQFFAESLSPFEMNLRSYQANARLLGLSETLAVQNQEIDRAREQLRTILDATTAVIYLKDADGRYVFVNRQFQEVFGLRREQVIGKLDAEVLPPDVAETLRRDDLLVLGSRAPQELEETIPASDGAHTYISLKFPLAEERGAPYAVCCVATDITERKRADEALQRAKQAVEDANRDLESFSYSVAHDLRAPLRHLDGFSQALLEDCAEQLDDHGKKYLRYIRESAQQMGQLIDDLLALSRVTRGELNRAPVDLAPLARAIGERLAASEPGRQVEFVITGSAVVHGDARLLAVVLQNLLGNAWKFTAKRERARIEFGQVREESGRTVQFVRDDGAGFDMAHAAKLFGVFQRLHSAGEFEGTGIGLATVHRVVRRHGGRVWGEGAVDRGATFYFTLEERPES